MSLPRPPRAVIFDMDGTLFDTEPLYEEGFARMAAALGCGIDPEFVRRTVGLPQAATKELLQREYGHRIDANVIYSAWDEECDGLMSSGVQLKRGALELLERLEKLSIPRAIATSTRRLHVDRNFAGHDLLHHFQTIVAQGDYARGKPHPEPFLLAAQRLGVAPRDCLALEDSHNGVASALAAGMMTVMIPDTMPATDEQWRLCCLVAEDLHEVVRLFDPMS